MPADSRVQRRVRSSILYGQPLRSLILRAVVAALDDALLGRRHAPLEDQRYVCRTVACAPAAPKLSRHLRSTPVQA